jgi:4-amino-4-deoxy-L-arabinose transferase-like glycosyltransferase
VLILIAYVSLTVAYSLASPLYEPSDELRHFRYVRHVIVYHSLPVQTPEGPRAQSHHPPLYYVLGALASWWVDVEQEVYYDPPVNPKWNTSPWEVSVDNRNQYLHGDDESFPFHGVTLAVYVVRLMTVLIGAGVVWLTYCIGREVFPNWPALAVGGAALVAFNPQFIYLSGAINNDIPAALCGAAVLWACVRLVRNGPDLRADVTLGILYGLAILTKSHLAALLGLIVLAYVLAVWRTRGGSTKVDRTCAFVRGTLIVLGLAVIASGWWFWRNLVLYGDLLGIDVFNELWEGSSSSESWWAVSQSLPYLWSSLWGRFGYGQVPLPQFIYQGLLIFCGLALAGHLVPRRERTPLVFLTLLGTVVLTFTLIVVYYITIQPAGAMGRFLFPALPAFALLLMAGLGRFFPDRLNWVAGLAVTAALLALVIYALVYVLVPAFAPPRPLAESEIEAVPSPTVIEFGETARLLGYHVTPTTVQPGDTMEVTIYWQALARTDQNHVIFVHLLNDVGVMLAQRDTYPGLGRYPTTVWEPGAAFADTYRMPLPETAYAPDAGYVQVGIYMPDGPRLTTPDGRDAVRLATVEIQPLPGKFPNPLDVNFGNRVALIGYTLDRRVVQPGETIHLTLFWRALAPMEENYRVFAQVLGGQDQIWAHSDSWPVEGRSATSRWEPGDVVKDVRLLTVGETVPVGFYDIQVGVHARGARRLPVIAEDGHQLDNRLLLCKIRVARDE